MDAELKAYLDGMAANLKRHTDERMEASEKKLLGYIDERVVRYIDERIEASETKILGFIEASETRLMRRIDERTELVETKLLRAFHDWAKPYEMRVRNVVAIVNGFDERLALMEERISELERGKAS